MRTKSGLTHGHTDRQRPETTMSEGLACLMVTTVFFKWKYKKTQMNCLHVLCFMESHYHDVTMGTMASQITSLTIVYSSVFSDADQRKHQSSASLAFVRGIHRRPVNSPHKGPVTRKMFPFDDVIMQLEIKKFANEFSYVLCVMESMYDKSSLDEYGIDAECVTSLPESAMVQRTRANMIYNAENSVCQVTVLRSMAVFVSLPFLYSRSIFFSQILSVCFLVCYCGVVYNIMLCCVIL